MQMSTFIPSPDTKQCSTGSGSVIKMTNFSSLMLPPFESDEDLEANSSYQVEKLTPSTPILISESTGATVAVTKELLATTRPHCQKCPFPSCPLNKTGFHKVDSAYSLRNHMNACHTGRKDHDGPFPCPVRSCEYSVLGFKTLDISMRHLSIHHDPSRPFERYSSGISFTPQIDSATGEVKDLCGECSRNEQDAASIRPDPPKSIQDFVANSGSLSNESESDDSDPGSQPHETGSFQKIMAAITSHLLDSSGHDMVLLAHLMPQIHTSLQESFRTENASYTGSDYGTGGDNTGDLGDKASSTSRKSSTSSSHRKRGRDDREEDDERDDGDSERLKKPKGKPEPNESKVLRYACPFHKRWPHKYTNLDGTRYRSCSGPGQVEVRRLKAHLQKIHKHFQCEKCYSIFDEQLELCDHRRSAECQKQSDALKEGIDEFQWVLIKDILRVRRPKEKDKSDVEKWFDLWRVLFPNVPAPDHPWHDHTRTPMPQPTHDIENRLATVGAIISQGNGRDSYRLEPETYRRCMFGFRQFLEAEKVAARHAPGLSLNVGYPMNAPSTGFPMPQTLALGWEAASHLPSHIDPSMLDHMSSTSIQESLYSPFQSSSAYNATFDSNLPIVEQTYSRAQEAISRRDSETVSSNSQSAHMGLQSHVFDRCEPQPSPLRSMQTAAISNISTNVFAGNSAPEVMSFGQENASFPPNNVVGTSNFNSHPTETQYAIPAVNFDAEGSYDYATEPDTIATLLESELAAVNIRQAEIFSRQS